jgi:hypothetical protein
MRTSLSNSDNFIIIVCVLALKSADLLNNLLIVGYVTWAEPSSRLPNILIDIIVETNQVQVIIALVFLKH